MRYQSGWDGADPIRFPERDQGRRCSARRSPGPADKGLRVTLLPSPSTCWSCLRMHSCRGVSYGWRMKDSDSHRADDVRSRSENLFLTPDERNQRLLTTTEDRARCRSGNFKSTGSGSRQGFSGPGIPGRGPAEGRPVDGSACFGAALSPEATKRRIRLSGFARRASRTFHLCLHAVSIRVLGTAGPQAPVRSGSRRTPAGAPSASAVPSASWFGGGTDGFRVIHRTPSRWFRNLKSEVPARAPPRLPRLVPVPNPAAAAPRA